jgi:hypothetical protein
MAKKKTIKVETQEVKEVNTPKLKTYFFPAQGERPATTITATSIIEANKFYQANK